VSRHGDRSVLTLAFSQEVVAELERLIVEEVQRRVAEEQRFGWVTLERAGELLGISADAVRKRIERTLLEAHKYEGRWYVDTAVLDRVIRDAECAR
jgi:DNA-directed RNA polymerase specialized sigma24 family protein